MKSFLPDYTVSKVLLDSAHDAMPYYQYFKRENITPFIDLNGKGGRHRSTKMWYCRLYHILMLQHLDAWDLPFESPLKKLILNVA